MKRRRRTDSDRLPPSPVDAARRDRDAGSRETEGARHHGEPPPGNGRPLAWAVEAGAVHDVLGELQRQLRAQRRARTRGVAAVAVAVLVCFAAWRWPEPPPAAQPAPEVADAASSGVARRGQAAVRAAFSAAMRRVELQRGEAHFIVAKNPTRPFVVAAGGIEFRAVGTAFSIQLGERTVDMIVTAGTVAVDRAAPVEGAVAEPRTLAILEKGQRAVVEIGPGATAAPLIDAPSATELSQRLAWRAPRLEFSGTPLAQAIDMIHRAAARNVGETVPRIEIGDPALASVRLSGVLRADNIDTLLGVLETNYGIRAERAPDGRIVLHRTETTGAGAVPR
jgi:transmembrane sensor